MGDKKETVEELLGGLVKDMKKELGKQADLKKEGETTLDQAVRQYGKGALAAGAVGALAGIPLPVIGPISGFLLGAGGYTVYQGYKALQKHKSRKREE